MSFVEKQGFNGVGQSSWGPTGFILTDSDTSAHKLVKDIRKNFFCKDLQIEIIQGRNNGSVFKKIDSDIHTNSKKQNLKKE